MTLCVLVVFLLLRIFYWMTIPVHFPFMIKVLDKFQNKGNFFNLIKGTYGKSIAWASSSGSRPCLSLFSCHNKIPETGQLGQ